MPNDAVAPAAVDPSGFRDELRPRFLVPSLTAGAVLGVLEVVLATSFAALIFAGPLSPHVSAGIGLNLFAGAAIMSVVALRSSLRGSVATIQDTTAAILPVIAAGVAAQVGPGRDVFATVVVSIGTASVATGAFFLLLGTFRLGNLIRFVPYPVVGGFLAGTGWLLVRGATGVLTDLPLSFAALPDLATIEMAARWVPGLAFGVILLMLLRRSRHFLVLPGAVLASIGLFYVVMLATGNTLTDAEGGGWLLGPFPEAGLWQPWIVTGLGDADWGAILSQAGNTATLMVVAALALLLNASGVELAVNREMDLNRELRAAGLANVAAGAGGGMPGYQALSLTTLAHSTGARTRLVGLVAASFCVVVLLFGATVVSFLPRVMIGGLIMTFGLGFLVEWVVDARTRMRPIEYALVLVILVVIAGFGFLVGVGVGLVVAVALFVVDYSRTDIVKHTLSASSYRSNVDRAPHQRDLLRSAGDSVFILELQGFLFFGTTHTLLERIRARARDPQLPPVAFLILDFRRVTGLDASAVLGFTKTLQLAATEGFTMVLSDLDESLTRRLAQGGIAEDGEQPIKIFEDLDRAAEWCEERILEEAQAVTEGAEPIWERLCGSVPNGRRRLFGYLERLEVPAGHQLIRQGDPSDDMYFLEAGRLDAVLTREDGESMRLRSMGPGVVVGELPMYLGTPRSATVITRGPSVVYRLRRASIREMETRDPDLAAALHQALARMLAERLMDSLSSMEALLD